MFLRNVYLQEATEQKFDLAGYVASYKKQLNLCALTKFLSVSECLKFYTAFFRCQADFPNNDAPIFEQWVEIYTALLNEEKFCADLTNFMVMYQPSTYTDMWNSLINMIISELEHKEKYRVQYLSNSKVFFQFLQRKMDAIGETIKAQIQDQDVIKFVSVVNSVLTSHIFYMDKLLKNEVSANPGDEISHIVTNPLQEDVVELLNILEHADDYIAKFMAEDTEPINEAIVKKGVMKAREANIKVKKAERAFDEFVMKKVKKLREERRNRKHAEMVGEALRVNNEVKRLIKAGGLSILNPAIGVIYWVTSVVIDRHTDQRDRDILVGQIKDELEIVDEKISIAERNGDDKAKIELIRIRQRLQKEYQRIQKYRYEPNRN